VRRSANDWSERPTRAAARGDRGTLRLEGERLAARERVELCGAVERLGLKLLLQPELANGVGLPDEVGRAAERRHEIAGLRPGFALVTQGRLREVRPALGGWVDHGLVDSVQRALCEG
jgi:hypothetical protein